MLSLKVTKGTFPNIIFDWGETATPTERTCKQSKIIQRIEDIRGETYQQRLGKDIKQESSSWQNLIDKLHTVEFVISINHERSA